MSWEHTFVISCNISNVFSCRYPKKDVATYWECEDYSKAWGHGMDKNPLHKPMVSRSQEPMRDRTVFKTPITIPSDYKPLSPVPNRFFIIVYFDPEHLI